MCFTLQLPTSVIYDMLLTNTLCYVLKDLARSFRTIDNTAGHKRSHVTITSVHLMNANLWVQAAKFQKF